MFYTYIIECEDGTYYTGYSNNPWERFKKHKEGKGAKYTRSHKPKRLVYIEEFETKSEAMRRELQIKRLTRQSKIELLKLRKEYGWKK